MIELYTPTIEELWFKQQMLSDEETMTYNKAHGGSLQFPREGWETWYNKWIVNHEEKRFYRYIKNDDVYVGEVAYHFDETKQIYLVDVLIYAPCRHKGYGSKALKLLCEIAKKNKIEELYDEIAIDNSSIFMFFKYGFKEISRNRNYIYIRKKL